MITKMLYKSVESDLASLRDKLTIYVRTTQMQHVYISVSIIYIYIYYTYYTYLYMCVCGFMIIEFMIPSPKYRDEK